MAYLFAAAAAAAIATTSSFFFIFRVCGSVLLYEHLLSLTRIWLLLLQRQFLLLSSHSSRSRAIEHKRIALEILLLDLIIG